MHTRTKNSLRADDAHIRLILLDAHVYYKLYLNGRILTDPFTTHNCSPSLSRPTPFGRMPPKREQALQAHLSNSWEHHLSNAQSFTALYSVASGVYAIDMRIL